MENITLGQIAGAIGTITVFIGFIGIIAKWYKCKITDKFANVENRLDDVEDQINKVSKRFDTREKEFLKELENSNAERSILMRGELACLKGLYMTAKTDDVANSIKEIENYMMKKTHNL